MSERLAVCRALAAMIRSHGDPTEEEVTFVGMAAMQLGLSDAESAQVQATLKEGGDYDALLAGVTSRAMRAFLFRRVLAAALLDDQINEAEHAFIDKARDAFDIDARAAAEMVAWLKVGIEAERQINGLLAAR